LSWKLKSGFKCARICKDKSIDTQNNQNPQSIWIRAGKGSQIRIMLTSMTSVMERAALKLPFSFIFNKKKNKIKIRQ
jgi:hypothetical protein